MNTKNPTNTSDTYREVQASKARLRKMHAEYAAFLDEHAEALNNRLDAIHTEQTQLLGLLKEMGPKAPRRREDNRSWQDHTQYGAKAPSLEETLS